MLSSFALNDGSWRWSAGFEASVANALPMVLFSLAGHLSIGLIAPLGAFTVLYGTTMQLRERLRVLPLIATGFVAASVLGILCASNAWLTCACMIAVALLASLFVFGAGLGSPGPMQFVLVMGVSARLAVSARVGNASFHVLTIPVLVAVGALSAYIVVAGRGALSFARNHKGEASARGALFLPSRLDAEKFTITTRVVLAVATASVMSVLLHVRHGYWMVMVAGAVLQATHVWHCSAIRVVQRVLGTVLGVVIFALINLPDPRGAWLIGVLVLLQFAIEVVVARHYGLALTFITPTALTIAAAARTSAPGILIGERMLDTLMGALVALTVLWTSESITHRNRPT